MKTQVTLIPPPPGPPGIRAAAGRPDDLPRPCSAPRELTPADLLREFAAGMADEMRQITWPPHAEKLSGTLAIMILLIATTAAISVVSCAVTTAFRILGISS